MKKNCYGYTYDLSYLIPTSVDCFLLLPLINIRSKESIFSIFLQNLVNSIFLICNEGQVNEMWANNSGVKDKDVYSYENKKTYSVTTNVTNERKTIKWLILSVCALQLHGGWLKFNR